jgi:ArsR family transcriptional regulator
MKDMHNVFKALSDDTRLRILKVLVPGELCVCNIVAALDTIQPKVSFHLAALKEAGLIKDRKQGKWIHYSLDDSDIFRRFLLMSTFERITDESMMEDRERLKKFIQTKTRKTNVLPLKKRKSYCGR